jgi:hypothetical protein
MRQVVEGPPNRSPIPPYTCRESCTHRIGGSSTRFDYITQLRLLPSTTSIPQPQRLSRPLRYRSLYPQPNREPDTSLHPTPHGMHETLIHWPKIL